MTPTKIVIKNLYKAFAKFFWGSTGAEKRKHWSSWDQLCLPTDERGLGIRSLFDLNKATMAQLWWKFRTSIGSLWSAYMGNKYCKKLYPLLV